MPNIKNQYSFGNLEFISMLAHDMKNPIKAQIRAMNLLSSGALGEIPPDVKNIILNVAASNQYLQTLVDNVLGNYKINKGKFIPDKKLNDMRKTIESAISNIGILSEVKKQKIILNYQTCDTKKVYDEIEIQRVIINLLSNAFEYSSENTDIILKIENISSKLKVSIKSTMRIPGTNITSLKAGCGLGLSICEIIINAHNGKIQHYITNNGQFITEFWLN